MGEDKTNRNLKYLFISGSVPDIKNANYKTPKVNRHTTCNNPHNWEVPQTNGSKKIKGWFKQSQY